MGLLGVITRDRVGRLYGAAGGDVVGSVACTCDSTHSRTHTFVGARVYPCHTPIRVSESVYVRTYTSVCDRVVE